MKKVESSNFGWQALKFKSYKDYLGSYIWQSVRNQMIKIYPKCKDCGLKAKIVHHKHYHSLGNEKKRDLVTLCFNCHDWRHNKKTSYREN